MWLGWRLERLAPLSLKARGAARQQLVAGAAAARRVGPRSGRPSGADRRLRQHFAGGPAAAAWDEQDRQGRDDGAGGADEEGDLKAGVLGSPLARTCAAMTLPAICAPTAEPMLCA
jgi:hypothetical protein